MDSDLLWIVGAALLIGLLAFVLVAKFEEPLSGAALRRRRWWRATQIVLPIAFGHWAMVSAFDDGITDFYDPQIALAVGVLTLFALIALNWLRGRIAKLWRGGDQSRNAEGRRLQLRGPSGPFIRPKEALTTLIEKHGRNGSHVLKATTLRQTLEGRATRRIGQDTSQLGGVPAEPKPLDKIPDSRESPRR
jgi:hypothetical protein